MTTRNFILTAIAVTCFAFIILIPISGFAGDNHSHAEEGHGDAHNHETEDEHGHDEGHSDVTTINDSSAKAMKIDTLKAGPASIHETLSLTGRIILNQDKTAQVRARFPGVIKSAEKTVGDKIIKGQELAKIESNQSLQTYSIISPIDGVIIARNAAVGGMTGDDPVYVIADLSELWAEFFVFSRDIGHINIGQELDITGLTDPSITTRARIENLLPVTESSSQTIVARSVLNNAENKWRSGMTIRGDVILSEKTVPLAVKTSAIQRQEGSQVVYIKEGEAYEMRKVDTGLSDREWTEIRSGLEPGEDYVATNSFVVKADIGKSSAEHEH